MKKLPLILIPFLLIGLLACNDQSTSKNDAKEKTKQENKAASESKPKIDEEFLNDVQTFRDNIKTAMDDFVLYDIWKDVGSLTEKQYDEKIDFLFDKWKPDQIKSNGAETNILEACDDLALDYLNYVKSTALEETDKADYAKNNFQEDLKKLDDLLKPYQ
jgi:hypothetical protein